MELPVTAPGRDYLPDPFSTREQLQREQISNP
jgi:hypothetical protein